MRKIVNLLLSIFISFKIIFNRELDYVIYFGDINYDMSIVQLQMIMEI